ncbi:MAG TPA: carboxylating nicotinate-nucleotide diphosphorylase [bacterium]
MTTIVTEEWYNREFLKIVVRALKEDIGRGDITTNAIVSSDKRTLGVIFPKEEGVLCGVEIARMVFAKVDDQVKFEPKMKDGDRLSPGQTIATVIGSAASCLKAERTALNFMQQLSGIATLTRKFVDAAAGRTKILDTRKTTPGLRLMEKYAVRTGGGFNHRFGLYDMVLIKDNHIQIAGSITKAVQAVRQKKKRAYIEVEVRTMDEVKEAMRLPVNRLMLDNMRIELAQQAVTMVKLSSDKLETEISGGVNLDNIEEYADCGADYISIGALTHSAPAIDIALKMKSLGE